MKNRVSISVWIDWIFAWLKWPAALLMLVLLPGAIAAMLALLGRIAAQPATMLVFFGGLVVYGALWWAWFRRSRFTFFLALEHELTHALFALLTFHRVVNIHATPTGGGKMSFVGKGNWLITIAPYFFPTSSLALIFVFMFFPGALGVIGDVLIGASFAYHITSTLRETHPNQSDIRQAGRLFCVLLLPTANILSAGVVLAFAHGGLTGLIRFLSTVGGQTVKIVSWLGG